jgi:hypothetical protein
MRLLDRIMARDRPDDDLTLDYATVADLAGDDVVLAITFRGEDIHREHVPISVPELGESATFRVYFRGGIPLGSRYSLRVRGVATRNADVYRTLHEPCRSEALRRIASGEDLDWQPLECILTVSGVEFVSRDSGAD